MFLGNLLENNIDKPLSGFRKGICLFRWALYLLLQQDFYTIRIFYFWLAKKDFTFAAT
jgi:hypothetical protein